MKRAFPVNRNWRAFDLLFQLILSRADDLAARAVPAEAALDFPDLSRQSTGSAAWRCNGLSPSSSDHRTALCDHVLPQAHGVRRAVYTV